MTIATRTLGRMLDLIVLFSAIGVEFGSLATLIWALGRWRERRETGRWNRIGH